MTDNGCINKNNSLFGKLLNNIVFRTLIFDQVRAIHRELKLNTAGFSCDLLWAVKHGHVGIFMERVKRDQIQYHQLFAQPAILWHFCKHVRALSDFREIHNKFSKSFTLDAIDALFIRCEPAIIDYLFTHCPNQEFTKRAIRNAVWNGHLAVVQRIASKYKYTKETWARLMAVAAERNNTEMFQYIWNRAERDRFWSAKAVDAFAAHPNQPMIEMIFNEMDEQDERFAVVYKQQKPLRTFRPPKRSYYAFAISRSLQLSRYLYMKNQTCLMWGIDYYPEDLICGRTPSTTFKQLTVIRAIFLTRSRL
ncbi:hypothetical protein PPL_08597 [Heterostelium album PN500]|uniref:Uncharacterized protein n=1 Tax=Heterostelium pallidum (strain ATCC 26659 / Pp 5 / PN500) TaxID=670386 RepID=D3BJ72_HETP5|nr:hypothetical protein PPL_08597 [Heterostelium album PN500]EFA77952.1 hypothetical protein PPL_08597 [Heterostelium album PN500]|eukprot:XP_020430080.1 hypothetical protein PPL_08597 [Heterostelium album PN500]